MPIAFFLNRVTQDFDYRVILAVNACYGVTVDSNAILIAETCYIYWNNNLFCVMAYLLLPL